LKGCINLRPQSSRTFPIFPRTERVLAESSATLRGSCSLEMTKIAKAILSVGQDRPLMRDGAVRKTRRHHQVYAYCAGRHGRQRRFRMLWPAATPKYMGFHVTSSPTARHSMATAGAAPRRARAGAEPARLGCRMRAGPTAAARPGVAKRSGRRRARSTARGEAGRGAAAPPWPGPQQLRHKPAHIAPHPRLKPSS